MNFKSTFQKHFGRPQPFTLEQFLMDAEENVNHVAPGLRKKWGVEFKSMVMDSEATSTSTQFTTDTQVLIVINKQLLRDCYHFLNEPLRLFYKRNAHIHNVDEELFARMAMGACMMMAYWHEVAHVVRGHLTYKQKLIDDAASGKPPATNRIQERVLEIDADIFGGQFLLAQLSVVKQALPDISIMTYAHCYAIGIRGLYGCLLGPHGRHDTAQGSTHPNPIDRAYIAYTHGLARASKVGFSKADQQALRQAGQAALLEFEVLDLGFPVDPVVLENFKNTELHLWRSREKELFPYRLPPARAWRLCKILCK